MCVKVIHDPDEQVPETDGDQILFLGENFHSFAAEVSKPFATFNYHVP